MSGKRVALTFDFDAISVWIGSFGHLTPGPISRGEFGPVGVERILALLADQGIKGTFFVPGHTALAYPDHLRSIVSEGHEVGHHGFVHERLDTADGSKERWILERGLEALWDVASVRPIGYRSPSGDFSQDTPSLLLEHGFTYDSSLMGSDFHPYWVREGDGISPDRPYVFGRQTPLVELPYTWLLDDFPHFEYVRGGAGPGSLKGAREVEAIWLEEFAFYDAEISGGLFNLVMHPQVIGRGSRIRMLDRLIDAMRQAGVTFCSLGEAAAAAKAELPEPGVAPP